MARTNFAKSFPEQSILEKSKMSRLTQFIQYLQSDEHPNATQIRHFYTHLSIMPEIKKIRRDCLAAIQERKRRLKCQTTERF